MKLQICPFFSFSSSSCSVVGSDVKEDQNCLYSHHMFVNFLELVLTSVQIEQTENQTQTCMFISEKERSKIRAVPWPSRYTPLF